MRSPSHPGLSENSSGWTDPIKNRIVATILALGSDPRPPGSLKVRSEEGVWRIRVGDWRVGYQIDDAAREVIIIRVGHRSEFYD